MSTQTTRLIVAIKAAERATQSAKEVATRKGGLSKAHYSALFAISARPGITNAQLARACDVTPQAMNEVVHKLRTADLIEVRQSAAHARAQEITLTTAGERAFDDGDRHVLDLERSLAQGFSAAELKQLHSLLGRVVDQLSAPTKSGQPE